MAVRQKKCIHWILLPSLVGLVCSTSYFVYLNFFSTWSDAAGYVSLLESIKNGEGMVSPMYNAGTWFFEIDNQTSLDIWCSLPSVNRFENFSRWHPYLVLYPLSMLGKATGINSLALLSFFTALSYLIIPFVVFQYLRAKTNFSTVKVIIFTLGIMSVPAWSGGLEGQIQSDRLFVGVGFLVTLMILERSSNPITRPPWNLVLITSLTIVGILISERAAVYLALIFAAALIQVTRFKNNALKIQISVLMSVCVVYFLCWKILIEDSSYYGRTSFSYFLRNIEISFTSGLGNSLVFFVSVSLLLFFAKGNTLSFSLAAALLLPQFIWSTGGSEKVGFITQYHAGYIGPLIACAVFGLASATNSPKRFVLESHVWPSVRVIASIFYIILMITSNFWTSNLGHQMNPAQLVRNLGLDQNHMKDLKKTMDLKLDFVSQIPPDNWISSPEFFMPALTFSNQHNVDYFPFGLRYNAYAIVTKEFDEVQLISPWLEYILPKNNLESDTSVRSCILSAMKNSILIKSMTIGNTRYELVKLIPESTYLPYPAKK